MWVARLVIFYCAGWCVRIEFDFDGFLWDVFLKEWAKNNTTVRNNNVNSMLLVEAGRPFVVWFTVEPRIRLNSMLKHHFGWNADGNCYVQLDVTACLFSCRDISFSAWYVQLGWKEIPLLQFQHTWTTALAHVRVSILRTHCTHFTKSVSD